MEGSAGAEAQRYQATEKNAPPTLKDSQLFQGVFLGGAARRATSHRIDLEPVKRSAMQNEDLLMRYYAVD